MANAIEDSIVVIRNHIDRMRRTWRYDDAEALHHALQTIIGEPDHILHIGEEGWSIEHPITCKGDQPLHECPVHLKISAWMGTTSEPPLPVAQYVIHDIDEWLEAQHGGV